MTDNIQNVETPLSPEASEPAEAAAAPRRRGFSMHWPMLVLLLVCVLLTIGITTLFSASAYAKTDAPYYYIQKQLLFVAAAMVAGVVVAFTPISLARRYAWWLGIIILGLLVVTLIPGVGVLVKGSRRWLDLGPMNLQASELAKVTLVFLLAHYLASNQSRIPEFVRGFLVPLLIIGAIALPIFRQPDYGTTALCGLVGMTVLFLAGARWRYMIPTMLLGLAAFSFKIAADPVRRERITSFLNIADEKTQQDGGYQLWQAILAFGAGGVTGVGVGNGRQQMNFLPEAHNDFILAITGEEMGLFATLGVVLLFVSIFIVGLVQIRRAPNLFHYLMLCGCFCCIAFQAIINLGVVTGVFPTKGMSLPFVSYGGSNLVLMGIIIGLIFNLNRTANRGFQLHGDRSLVEL